MFTGIIEEIGKIKTVVKGSRSIQLTITATKVLTDASIGDSIATNGICLTVTEFSPTQFSVDVMSETLKRSSLSDVRPGMEVNLERALRVGDRLGGHMVSGHIDGMGKIVDIKEDDNAVWYTITAPKSIMKYIIEKGSIAIDGISLTVAYATHESFSVSIIPHTQKETVLQFRKIGDSVNLECDMTAKYIERFAGWNEQDNEQDKDMSASKGGLSIDMLSDNGFV